MSKVDARYSPVLPAPAECVLVIQQAQLLNDVIHDQVGVDLRPVRHVLLVRLA